MAVVLTRDRPQLLRRALDSLRRGDTSVQILVIDNASEPAAAELIAAECAARPDTHLHRSDTNLGCAGGRRLGVEMTDAETVLFLDDDAEVMPGAIEHLVKELDAHPEAGAVSATVVSADGALHHSGGSLEQHDGIVTLDLIGAGLRFAEEPLPPSGTAGWVPGTAALIRRELLERFPIDPAMGAYYEDNEWCYRVSQAVPDCFRRSREALVLHHVVTKPTAGADLAAREVAVARLGALAHFYSRHGQLLGPWLFHVVPGLCSEDGTCDVAAGRLLLELVLAKGPEWTLNAWTAGDLSALYRRRELASLRRRIVTATAESERARTEHAELQRRAQEVIDGLEERMAYLQGRHEALTRIEAGGWWRLRLRLLPMFRLVEQLRRARRRDSP